jgi:hypothetical protein
MEGNIKMDLTEIWCEDLNWIDVAQGFTPVADSCHRDNELLVSIREAFFRHLSDYELLKKDSLPWS